MRKLISTNGEDQNAPLSETPLDYKRRVARIDETAAFSTPHTVSEEQSPSRQRISSSYAAGAVV